MNATTQNPNQPLAQSAAIFLGELLQLKTGEDVLIYFDEMSDRRVAEAIARHAREQGHRVEFFQIDTALPLAEQAARIAEHIRRGRFQVVCELSEQCFYLTEAWSAVYEVGARPYCIAGLDAEAFIRCIGSANHQRMFALGMALRALLLASRRLEIRSTQGTNLRMKLGWGILDRLAAKIRGGPRAFMTYPSGYQSGFSPGQLAFRGIPHTVEGTAVIDGYLWPPAEIGLLEEPIVLAFKAGKLVDIGGSPRKAKILDRWFEDETVLLEHVCFGFNPGARFTGKIVEAERVFGCLDFGIGSGLRHIEGVMRTPSVYLNGNLILKNGKFVTQELAALEGKLLE
jgi:leucyl aminopeptidase (aminopeptidase T)